MAPNTKFRKACKVMNMLGISEEIVKPVLKNLLDLYDKNWKLIEDENYRVLLEAIFDREEEKKKERKKLPHSSDDEPEENETPLKRSRLSCEKNQSMPSCSGFRPSNRDASGTAQHMLDCQVSQSHWTNKMVESSSHCEEDEDIKPVALFSSNKYERKGNLCTPLLCPKLEQIKETDDEVEDSEYPHVKAHEDAYISSPDTPNKRKLTYDRGILTIPCEGPSDMPNLLARKHIDANFKSESLTDDHPDFEVPLAVVHPGTQRLTGEGDSTNGNHPIVEEDYLELPEIIYLDLDDTTAHDDSLPNGTSSISEENILESLQNDSLVKEKEGNEASVSSQIYIASSASDEVKISLTYRSSLQSDFHLPSLDEILREVEHKCLKTYGITQPGFSLVSLMKEVCECFLKTGIIPTDANKAKPVSQSSKISSSKDINYGPVDCQLKLCFKENSCNGSVKFKNLLEVLPHIQSSLGFNTLSLLHYIVDLNVNANDFISMGRKIKVLKSLELSSSSDAIIVHNRSQHSPQDPFISPYFMEDITRGEEGTKVSLLNDVNDEHLPAFKYIPRSIAYQNAHVKFSLAHISERNCCHSCFGDCLSLELPCACASGTGGEFVYSQGGLVKESFLKNYMESPRLIYCEDCPLERSTAKRKAGTCKGHYLRKFIKECWYKCGCGKKCGNRVVQRGINAKLQVFMTAKGKGWGLRALEDLPKGAFVCEYAAEIVTSAELFERIVQSTGKKHTYPVLLDADWSSEGVIKNEALCLDATFYGNVGRFINHRCHDANLVDIPVEVETPDHQYYHVAFFTTRKVNALEELTWDSGIDFTDNSCPSMAFRCQCGSKLCRDKRPLKSQ